VLWCRCIVAAVACQKRNRKVFHRQALGETAGSCFTEIQSKNGKIGCGSLYDSPAQAQTSQSDVTLKLMAVTRNAAHSKGDEDHTIDQRDNHEDNVGD
jgi:hypothetical protein